MTQQETFGGFRTYDLVGLRCEIRGVLFAPCPSPDLPRLAQTSYHIDHARNITLLPFYAV